MLRFGLIGCGLHGERYLRHIRQDVEGADVACLWRIDPHRRRLLARRWEVEEAASLEALLEHPDVDAFLITTPPGAHAREVEVCLATGRPILVEKPVCAFLEEADALWRRHGDLPDRPLMVAQTLRFHPTLQRAVELARDLGEVHRVRIQQRLEPTELAWQRDDALSGGGSITLTGVHLFDLLRWLVGRSPDAVSARMLAVEGYPTVNLFDACFEYEAEGLLAATEVSKFSASRSCVLEVVGTRAQLVVDYLRGTIDRVEGRERIRLEEPGHPPTLPATVAAFRDALRRGGPMPVGFLDGRETLRMAAAAMESHRRGRRCRLDEIAPHDSPTGETT